MKQVLLIVAFVGALGAAMLFRIEQDRRASFEAGHRYIYGFHTYRMPRQFYDYLKPVTADGLHEVRWDRMLPHAFSTAVTSSASSTWVIVPTTGSTTLTCTVPPKGTLSTICK